MFIDIHSHIIPGLDDGASSIAESVEMLRQAQSCGITSVVATPHFNNKDKCGLASSKRTYKEYYRNLKTDAAQNGIHLNLFLGSEVFYGDNLSELYKNDELITLNGSRYLLTEYDFDEKISVFLDSIREIMSFGLIPVIAHPERYSFLYGEYDTFFKIVGEGCIIQINKGSILGEFGNNVRKMSVWMLDNELCHIVAGDAHGAQMRNMDMSDFYNYMVEKYSVNYIKYLTYDNPKKILTDKEIY